MNFWMQQIINDIVDYIVASIFDMPRKLTTKIFIEKAQSKHGDKYDYSKVDYHYEYGKGVNCNKVTLLQWMNRDDSVIRSRVLLLISKAISESEIFVPDWIKI